MANGLSIQRLTEFARRGAAAAIAELKSEIAVIRRAFPDVLGGTARRGRKPGRPAGTRRPGKLSAAGRASIAAAQRARWAKIKKKGGGRKRKGMSAAARKAVGERMRRYWAARRAAEAGAKK